MAAASSRPRLMGVLKVCVTLGLFGVLLLRVDLSRMGARIASIGIGTAASCIGIILVLSVLVAVRWRVVLASMGAHLAFWACWRLVMIGLFFNQTLPSGIGGDAVRVWMVGRAGHRLRTGFISVAVDRMLALLAVVVCMLVTLPILLTGAAGAPLALLTMAGVAGFAALYAFDPVAGALARHFGALPSNGRVPGILARAVELARELSRVMLRLARNPGAGSLVLVLSLANQVALGFVTYLVARALGADIGLGRTVALFTPAMLISMVPISLGGWGVREAAMVWLFTGAGVASEAALGISVVFGLVTTAAGLIGGVLWLIDGRGGGRRPDAAESGPVEPRILASRTRSVSPWVSLVEREVDFGDGRVQIYHALQQADYVGILAVTPDGMIPIVRQFRPALERFTWELPAGMVDAGEAASETCRRELLEETGLVARRIHPLGIHAADSARMDNRVHSFLVEAEAADVGFAPEPGLEVAHVTWDRLQAMISSGDFDLQYHVGVVGLVSIRPELVSLLRHDEH